MKNLKKLFRSNDFGYYEKRLCFLLFLSAIPNAFPLLQSLVNQYTPPYRCDVSSIMDNVNKEAISREMNITSEQLNEYLLNLTIPYEQNNTEIFKRSSCKRYNVSFEYFQNLTKLSKNRIVDKCLLLCGWTAQSPATWYLYICSYVRAVFF
ncbi:uncharacterized protein LOC143451895 [Clavelina lepadiformis]|uniref:uncharacterized protein LOC143451895 n=1 Tax=Clavelina lepadiformis TaxID=159417 RepID=UPI0040431039